MRSSPVRERMNRYFFHIHECGELFTDLEGIELPDRSAVYREAVAGARGIMAGEVARGQLCLSCRIEVVDEEQRPVLTLPFKEALAVTGV